MGNYKFKCECCGEPFLLRRIEESYDNHRGLAECVYCGTVTVLPRRGQTEEVLNLLSDGNQNLYRCNFEEAFLAFRQASEIDGEESEAYFGMALAANGIQYLHDETEDENGVVTKRLQPVCHKLLEKPFAEDMDYKRAVAYTRSREEAELYKEKARDIDDIMKKFRHYQKEYGAYDCFICVKVSEIENKKKRTKDSKIAKELYDGLKKRGLKPFYSEEEIKGRKGVDYEALILYALYTSKSMLIVCSDERYLRTSWVENEYMRYGELIDAEKKSLESLTVVFADGATPVDRLPRRKGRIQGFFYKNKKDLGEIADFVSKKAREKTPEELRREEAKRQAEEQARREEERRREEARREEERKREEARKEEERKREEARREEERKREEARRAEERKREELEKYNKQGVDCYDQGNYEEAVKYWLWAAEQGLAEAQYNLALCYKKGEGVTKNQAEAVKWYKKAAEQGYADAQFSLALCYENGRGVTKNQAEAVKWYQKAAEQGHTDAQFNLAVCYDFGKGVTKNEAEAVKWYQKAAEQGYADAQFNLGVCYENGEGVTKNEAEAVKWYQKAAEQGHAKAQYNLGVFYKNGWGVTENEAEAVKWFKKAAEQGYADAQYNLGVCYDNGEGVTKNQAEAVKWYQKAAEQGDADAQYNLALCYANGEGVTKNEAEAVKWYQKAAEKGYASAQHNLALCYFNGEGIPCDKAKAKYLFEQAAKNGSAAAKKALEEREF